MYNRSRILRFFAPAVLIAYIWLAHPALAQRALSNGGNHSGTLQVGGLDAWTFVATKNDGITLSLGKVVEGGAADPDFVLALALKGPDGVKLDDPHVFAGENSVQIDLRAPLTGTYTVLVSNSQTSQTAPVSYVLTLTKTPGPYLISVDDEGGPLTNGSHAGRLSVGDQDPWIIQAAQGDGITLSLGNVAADPDFVLKLVLKGPDGVKLDDPHVFAGENSVQIGRRAPLTGTYTVLVSNSETTQTAPVSYVLTLAGPSGGFSVSAILAVVGSAAGNGAFFRTRVQMHNPRSTPISGKLVFHPQGTSGRTNDPSLSYTLAAGQTVDYPDLLPAMGLPAGLGSVDIITAPGNPVPIMSARIFSDAGTSGTAGFFIEPVGPDASLQTGDSGVLVAPADPLASRLNLGIRSLESGASFLITIRDRNGAVRKTINKTYGPMFFEQVSASTYLGISLDPSDSITFTINSGKAIIYGAQTDNKTQDPSLQYAKRSL